MVEINVEIENLSPKTKNPIINKDQQIMIGKPRVYPQKLANTLKSYFEGNWFNIFIGNYSYLIIVKII